MGHRIPGWGLQPVTTSPRFNFLLTSLARTAVCAVVLVACSSLLNAKSSRSPDGEIGTSPAASESVYIEVRALDSTSTPPQQLSQPVRLTNGADQSLVVPAPIHVHPVNTPTRAVEGAAFSFTAHAGIPNRPLPPIQTLTLADGTFDVLLPPGSYSVLAYPPSAGATGLPPQYFPDISTDQWSNPSTDTPPPPDFSLWDFASAPQISGVLHLLDGTPAAGVQVSLLDSTASAATRHLLTAPVLTDSAGAFTMKVPPVDAQPAFMKLHLASGTPSGVPFPALDSEQTFAAGTTGMGLQLVSLAKATIAGRVLDTNRAPVARARVTVIAQPSLLGTQAPFEFQDSTVSEADGSYSISVYVPGDGGTVSYSLIAQPPVLLNTPGGPGLCRPTTPVGGVVTPATNLLPIAVDESVTQDLSCDVLLSYTGSIRTSDDTVKGVGGARVTATLIPTVDLPAGLTVTTTADSRGNFDFPLTPGTYNLAFFPVDASKLPFTLYQARTISAATAPAAGTQITFALLPAFNLTGRLYLGDAQHPLEGQLDAYQVFGTTAIKIASGITGPDGKYSLILPGTQVR